MERPHREDEAFRFGCERRKEKTWMHVPSHVAEGILSVTRCVADWLFEPSCLDSLREQSAGSTALKVQARLSYCEDRYPIQPEQSLAYVLGGQGPDVAGRG